MEIHEITRLKAQKLDEGPKLQALGGIAKQYIQQKLNPNQDLFGPVAAIGQEKAVAKALTDPVVNQLADQAYQSWQQGVQAKLQQFKKSDASQLGRNEIETMLNNYVDQRLLPGSLTIDSIGGPPVAKNAVKRAMEPIILNTLANKWRDASTANAWMKLIQAIRIVIFQTPTGQPGGIGQIRPQTQQATQLTPAAQAHLQTLAPGIRALQGYWPQGQTTKVAATNNQAVNAVLSGLGLLI